jgi:hypothetical protein
MPSGEWTDGAFRRARIVAARLAHSLNLAQGVGDAIAAYLVCRSSICPSDHVFT